MEWFKEVFLKGFDEKFDSGKPVWLTEKQVWVCRKYMKASEYYSFFYIISGEWQYSMRIMKKGYGRLVRDNKAVAYH